MHPIAAEALIRLYQSDKLSTQDKQRILSQKSMITQNLHEDRDTQAHTDSGSDSDYRSDCHDDSTYPTHIDKEALGAEFPL
jgi:hypothetical protein